MKGDQVHFCWPDCRCGCQRENQNIKNDCEEDERCISSKFESACCLGKYQNETCFIYVLNNIFMFGNCLLAEDYTQARQESLSQSLAQVPALGRKQTTLPLCWHSCWYFGLNI